MTSKFKTLTRDVNFRNMTCISYDGKKRQLKRKQSGEWLCTRNGKFEFCSRMESEMLEHDYKMYLSLLIESPKNHPGLTGENFY